MLEVLSTHRDSVSILLFNQFLIQMQSIEQKIQYIFNSFPVPIQNFDSKKNNFFFRNQSPPIKRVMYIEIHIEFI